MEQLSEQQLESSFLETQEEISRLYKEISILTSKQMDTLVKMGQEHSKLTTLSERVNKVCYNEDKIIRLDVGGQIFSTTVETLNREKDTFFSIMLSEQWMYKSKEKDVFFIDRDPT
jgi:hypothetical protein